MKLKSYMVYSGVSVSVLMLVALWLILDLEKRKQSWHISTISY